MAAAEIVYPAVGDVWRHYKGGTYRIIACAVHTENYSIMVVYQNREHGEIWVRPLTGPGGFLVPIECGAPRFALVSRDCESPAPASQPASQRPEPS